MYRLSISTDLPFRSAINRFLAIALESTAVLISEAKCFCMVVTKKIVQARNIF